MEKDQHIGQAAMTGPETSLEIKTHPFMGFIFFKAVLLSFFRPDTIADGAVVNKTRMVLKNFLPDKKQIKRYRQVCGFSQDRPDIIPISYFQTLFIGLLGRFITASFFPVNPLGLIHIFQSFDQKKPVTTDEPLDLACSLIGIKKTQKGIESSFNLEVLSGGILVWHGISVFFTRSPAKKEKTAKNKQETFLEKKETLFVPPGIGRRYAAVSGDYNPHHLYTVLAKLFGFKKAIAHGMWSLASVIARLNKKFGIHDSARIEASFKLPIFMPATTTLGYECTTDKETDQILVNFELRDEQKGLPHIKGRLLKPLPR
ncbi:MAG: hypothetical protein KKE44_02515 [Proteobacteria bacterium]|nr:hypothetical protein [Pseudomonadota bacterium]MBU1581599.1 hypothetical protein [Pseudomonadota bacterium]MBU2452249.1 hypothetical protein [Pseudomonadota bacterium]MBU2628156.1 hypothetical protein [Pseudomonadota bacterium]